MRRMMQLSFAVIANQQEKPCHDKYWFFFLSASLKINIEQPFFLFMFSRSVVSNVFSFVKKVFYMG